MGDDRLTCSDGARALADCDIVAAARSARAAWAAQPFDLPQRTIGLAEDPHCASDDRD